MTDKTIRLPDGRQLSYAEYGDPDGMPLLYFHGTLGSRLEPSHLDPLFRDIGVRVVAPERPGYALSDVHPKPTLLDWVHDVEVLADSLHLERFALMGLSGGGPYVAATAYTLSERVTEAAFVSAACPLTLPDATRGMGPTNRLQLRLARMGPWAVNLLMQNMARGTNQPERLRKQFSRALPPVDAAALQHDEYWHRLLADIREGMRNGTRGATWDIVLWARPWGFRLEEIQVPTSLWHGEADTNVPVTMGRAIARAIPNCQATFVPGEGHLSLILKHEEEIFRSFFAPKRDNHVGESTPV
jgi:pimeloyl-ACP methyl ester carboxylesterase